MSTTSSSSFVRAASVDPIASTSRGPTEARTRRFEDAIQLLEEGLWQESFSQLAELADAGHPQAARIALLLVARGSVLFGGSFMATQTQRRAWRMLAA